MLSMSRALSLASASNGLMRRCLLRRQDETFAYLSASIEALVSVLIYPRFCECS